MSTDQGFAIIDRASYLAAAERLKAASAAYYRGQVELMSDFDYDQLWGAVAAAEEGHPEWVEGSPVTAKVAGGAVTGDVQRAVPMLSLDNTYNTDELTAWLNRVTTAAPHALFIVEPKLDGNALSLIYRNGDLILTTTRGSGDAGEDVSGVDYLISNVIHSGVHWADGAPFNAELRGEAIFTHDQFEQANGLRVEYGDKPFANPRNGLAGTLKGGASRDYRTPFIFVCYQALVHDRPDLEALDYNELMSEVAKAGFQISAGSAEGDIPLLSAADVPAAVERFEQQRHSLNVDTDGAVIKVAANSDRVTLGQSSRAPRWAIAYKFPPEEVTSVLREVLWQVGKTGVITPRAVIDPVQVGGTTITYTTLHNPGDIARKGFMLGDTVLVKRAGEVIPRLEAPVVAARSGAETPIVPPQVCPQCGGTIDTSQERWRCVRGRECGLAEAITYAVSRDALDIDGLGKVQVANLVRSKAVLTLAHLFNLTETQLVQDGGVAPANAPKILAQIRKAYSATPARVITALSIRGTGRSLSRALARRFGTLSGLAAATAEQLAGVDKIGPIKAGLIVDQLADLSDVVDWLVSMGIGQTPDEPMRVTPGGSPAGTYSGDNPALIRPLPLGGKTVVVTGSMVGPLATLSRNDMNELIEKLGGKASGSVSKNTSLLVVGQNAGSKLAKATELGVPVMTEDQFAAEVGL